MSKFYTDIGYAQTTETSPGIWEEVITTHKHYGEMVRNISKLVTSSKVNDDNNMSCEVSIMADTYSVNNIANMRYIVLHQNKWKITAVEDKYPRLILTIGGLYTDDRGQN